MCSYVQAHVVKLVQSRICKALGYMHMPLSARAWYQCVLIVIPSTSPQASIASRSSTGLVAPVLARKALLRHVLPEELVEWRVPVTHSQSFYALPVDTDLSLVHATVL